MWKVGNAKMMSVLHMEFINETRFSIGSIMRAFRVDDLSAILSQYCKAVYIDGEYIEMTGSDGTYYFSRNEGEE